MVVSYLGILKKYCFLLLKKQNQIVRKSVSMKQQFMPCLPETEQDHGKIPVNELTVFQQSTSH